MKLAVFLSALLLMPLFAAARIEPPVKQVDTFDFFEITLRPDSPIAGNPFRDAELSGSFTGGGRTTPVTGFCDSQDGSVYRIRFMPEKSGSYAYLLTFKAGGKEEKFSGKFKAVKSTRKGMVKGDPEHPWHFVWTGTGEHFFWNGTTTYSIAGWQDDIMYASLDRLAKLGVNRIRASINSARVESGMAWFEPVYPSDKFSFLMNPWVAARPTSVGDPGYDLTRFNVAHWQKYERLLKRAREQNVIVSVIFYVDGRRPGVDPFGKENMGNDDEQRYYRYAAARLAPFANIMWDVTNEWKLFRTPEWVKKMGALLEEADPYKHPISVHGHGDFPYMAEPWVDFAMYQIWDEYGGYKAMLQRRADQEKAGKIIPVVNEEYGYEDHYPQGWGENRKAPTRSGDNRRRIAWEMYMAGCYQTTGERADVPNMGGWITGRGDDSMTMLAGYAKIRSFFEAIPFWKLQPKPEWVEGPAMLLAEMGKQYVAYQNKPGAVRIALAPGGYNARWYNPRTGEWKAIGKVSAGADGKWSAPAAPDGEDWALLLTR